MRERNGETIFNRYSVNTLYKTKIEYDPHLQSVWLKVKFPTLKIIAVATCILH